MYFFGYWIITTVVTALTIICITLPYEENHLPLITTILLSIFIILTHLPSILKQSQRRKILGKLGFEKHNKVSIGQLVILLFAWTISARDSNSLYMHTISGIAVISAIGFTAFVAGKLQEQSMLQKASNPTPLYVGISLEQFGKKILFSNRALLALISLAFNLSIVTRASSDLLSSFILLFAIFSLSISISVQFYLSKFQHVINSKSADTQNLKTIYNLKALKPEFVIYYSAQNRERIEYLLTIIKMMNSINKPFFVLVREKVSLRWLLKNGVKDIVLVEKLESIDSYMYETLRAAIYINDAEKNGHFVRYNELDHILILRTPFSYQKGLTLNYAMYSHIVVGSREKAEQLIKSSQPQFQDKIIYYDTTAASSPSTQPEATALGTPLPPTKTNEALILGWDIKPFVKEDMRDWRPVWQIATMVFHYLSQYAGRPVRLAIRIDQERPNDQYFAAVNKALQNTIANWRSSDWIIEVNGSSADIALFSHILLITHLDDLPVSRYWDRPALLFDCVGQQDARKDGVEVFKDFYTLSPDFSNFDAVIALAALSDPKKHSRRKARKHLLALTESSAPVIAPQTLTELILEVVNNRLPQSIRTNSQQQPVLVAK